MWRKHGPHSLSQRSRQFTRLSPLVPTPRPSHCRTSMAIRVALNHVTHYTYGQAVTLSPHVVRLRPAPHCRTPVTGYSLRITPAEHFINWQQDPFGNYQARLVFTKPARELKVEVDLVAEMTTVNPFDFFLEEYAETF